MKRKRRIAEQSLWLYGAVLLGIALPALVYGALLKASDAGAAAFLWSAAIVDAAFVALAAFMARRTSPQSRDQAAKRTPRTR